MKPLVFSKGKHDVADTSSETYKRKGLQKTKLNLTEISEKEIDTIRPSVYKYLLP